MTDADDARGHASGFTVEEDPEQGWLWSAFGPAGTRQGTARSRADAEAAGRAAEEELKRPRGTAAS